MVSTVVMDTLINLIVVTIAQSIQTSNHQIYAIFNCQLSLNKKIKITVDFVFHIFCTEESQPHSFLPEGSSKVSGRKPRRSHTARLLVLAAATYRVHCTRPASPARRAST